MPTAYFFIFVFNHFDLAYARQEKSLAFCASVRSAVKPVHEMEVRGLGDLRMGRHSNGRDAIFSCAKWISIAFYG
ncbi:hypothetical protein TH3_08410 [Thalassospira xiamenensis M-5 = DSM 17429]|uniref:Secreted protein n=1 Tax=Thalassospira xiamenensis M-5 = DSM 17429 TaxID=1123366 RepID=A0AB72UBT6_9PROT|nr:hypothetical protein TH3_08410 [Thalassospira xiamenensis M-5 = DSM 17429]